MAKLTLIRGLPGSGKSTYAKTHHPDAAHYEADMFFLNDCGVYTYDRNLIGEAHEWCYSNTVMVLKNGFDVVVSNTFCAEWEMEKYLALPSLLHDVDVEIIEMRTQYGSIHDVPQEAVDRMKARWYIMPESYNVKVIK
jgi:predicted kinase